MRVYYIYESTPAYRTDFYIALSKELKKNDIDFMVLSGTDISKKVVLQDKSQSFNKKVFQTKKVLRFFKTQEGEIKFFKQNIPDLVIISYIPKNLSFLWIIQYCIRHHIPYITWRCGYNRPSISTIAKAIRKRLLKYVEKNATKNITYGSYYKNELIKKGIPESQIVIAQNTINVEKIIARNQEENYRKTKNEKLKVLFVGALIKQKLLDTSINAIKLLVNEGIDVQYDIVGGGTIIDSLKEQVTALNLENHVFIHGPKFGDEVRLFFLQADIFLLAGIGGLAINEAMAYSLPIISTNADWTVCDLIDGNGFYMDKYGDAQLQYQFIKKFISLSQEERDRMAQRSLEIISSKATLANMVSKHADTIKSVLLAQQ